MIHYFWSGKFESSSPKWCHISRKLGEYELMLVEKGTLYIGDDKQDYEIHENEYLIMPPCKRQHGTRSSSCTFHWLHFLPSESIPCPLQGTISSWDQILSLLNAIYRSEQQNHHSVSSHLTEALLWELSYHSKKEQAKSPAPLKNKIDNCIAFHQDGNLRITEISHQLGYNEKYLSRLFLKETGKPLKRYLMEHNLEQAKSLLLNTNDSVEKIAMYCGYTDSHNFTRMFRTELGMSPSVFRQKFHQK